jgi:GNAT superfamily N-acetyltransferase
MTTADADAVLAGIAGLSPESHRFRFFGPGPRLSPAVRDDLVAIAEDRIVLLAFDADGTLVGEARAIRHRDDRATADVAITVGDRYQNRGLGSKLLRMLGRDALAVGIDRLAGHVLIDNPGARAMLIRNGAVASFFEPGVLAFEIPLGRHRRVTPAVATRRRLGLAS